MKKIIRILTLGIISIYLLYCCYHVITNESNPRYRDCGEVISKSNDEVVIKHGTKTKLYLNINFEKSGFRSIECTPTTYFSHNKGDYVCFNLLEDVSIFYQLSYLIGVFVFFILGCILIYYFLTYLGL
jgi:hypothetical protein